MTDFSPPPVDAFVVTSGPCAKGECRGCDNDPIIIGKRAFPCACLCHVLVEVTCGESTCGFAMMVRPLGPVIAVNHGEGPPPAGVWHGLVNCLDPGLRTTPAPDEDTAEDRMTVEVPTGPRLVGVDELEVSGLVSDGEVSVVEEGAAPSSHFAVTSDGAVTQWLDLSTYLEPDSRDVVTIGGRRYGLARKTNGSGYRLRPLDGR